MHACLWAVAVAVAVSERHYAGFNAAGRQQKQDKDEREDTIN